MLIKYEVLCHLEIINNLCLSTTESVKEAVSSMEVYREVILTYHQCSHEESVIELTNLIGNMVEVCFDYLGVEVIQDSGLSMIVDEKLDAHPGIELMELLLRLKVTLISLKACPFDQSF